MRRLAGRTRRRRRGRIAWMTVAGLAATAGALVAWEAVSGPDGGARPYGYAFLATLTLAVVGAAARAWCSRGPAADEVAGRLERLFPQVRGGLSDALAGADGELSRTRADRAWAWVSRRGTERLDRALGEEARVGIERWRRVALALVAAAVVVALAQPVAARRVGSSLSAGGWWDAGERWSVEPGDVTVEYDGALDGRLAYRGPAVGGPVLIEWREPAGAWRAETLGTGRSGAWRWSGLRGPREYRPGIGDLRGPVFRVEVAAPLMVRALEARRAGGAWMPVADGPLPAELALDLRGSVTGPVTRAEVRMSDRTVASLTVDGAAFAGRVRLPPGTARIAVGDAGGRTAFGPPFVVAAPGAAFVAVLEPEEERVRLRAASLRLTVRAGAADGLASLAWRTMDGRGGRLGEVGGARDTTVSGIAALAVGRAPGDTVHYRVEAIPVVGAAASSPWRMAIVPDLNDLRGAVAAERAEAAAALDRAVAEAGEAGRSGLDGREGRERAGDLDARLRATADSLARALERTLADPGLDPHLAERLEEIRRLLEGTAAAELAPRAGLGRDPVVAAEARAAMLAAIRERARAVEDLLARSAAADSLGRLAAAERDLARQTRSTAGERLAERIAPRQARLEKRAREAVRPLGEAAAGDLDAALDRARSAVEAGRAEAAAGAQEEAAARMDAAAREAREEIAGAAEADARRRAALDRAGGQALFLAERQRAVLEVHDGAEGTSERLELPARQAVVTRGLERALGSLVAAIGGRPAGGPLAGALARAVYRTRMAERALAGEGVSGLAAQRAALADAGAALASLTRELLLPSETTASGMPGAGARGETGALARQLAEIAEAQAGLADALGRGEEAAGGNPAAAVSERRIARALKELTRELAEAGMDAGAAAAVARAASEAAARLERGLPGARTESELRGLARRIAELGRAVERSERERRRSETARPFVPIEPPPLPSRASARRLDPDAALAPWEGDLPREAEGVARRYLERLRAEGVRDPGREP